MIIKIVDFEEDIWMYDGVQSLFYKRHYKISHKSDQEWYSFIKGIDVAINQFLIPNLTPEDFLKKYTLLSFRRGPVTENPFQVLLGDCVCYICNDMGKTIDKLVC